MNNFIMNLKMEHIKAKKEKQEIEIKIKRCFLELNGYITPYFKTAFDIKAEEIEQIGDELLKLKTEFEQVENKIAELKQQLGED
ncbi:MAG: hypothetical protein K6C94_02230 [Candidatus Gastranaerophilales bacterium]|nr:hypothetical protein [Candidatus Gastranaerophilales bacterium]